jgi:hypothetical protein
MEYIGDAAHRAELVSQSAIQEVMPDAVLRMLCAQTNKRPANPRSSALARRILRLFHILWEGVLGRKTDRTVRVNSCCGYVNMSG